MDTLDKGCATNSICSMGRCKPSAAPGSCSGMVCNGACVNLQSDSQNCGRCGNACPDDPNEFCCRGRCVDVGRDRQNCGACGNVCLNGYKCAAGTCVSPAVMHSGVQTSPIAVTPTAGGVVVIAPANGFPGVIQATIGLTATSFYIPTAQSVTSCASNWATGDTVCSSSGTDRA